MPIAVLALTAGAFGIGVTEFVIMGLLLQVAADLHVSTPVAGQLISGYALGVVGGAPLLTLATRALPRKLVLIGLMVIFVVGNAACALAPTYSWLLAARILTSLAHGAYFGVGAVVAADLVRPERRASAIATMFAGLTAATLIGVPIGAWIGEMFGWRFAFWGVASVGLVALAVLGRWLPTIAAADPGPLWQELSVLRRPRLHLGLAVTVFGFGGLFAVFTYIQPILIEVTGHSAQAVSGVLLMFGAGFAVGNLAGGRFADRRPSVALPATLGLLLATLLVLGLAIHDKIAAAAVTGLLGAAAFATAAPLQTGVLDAAGPRGRTLASSLNIAAFNLGNALGAAAGGAALARGGQLADLPWVAAGLTGIGLGLALLGLQRRRRPAFAEP